MCDITHLFTYFTHSFGKPLLRNTTHKKFHSKESYVFAKSTFHRKPLIPCTFHVEIISFVNIVLSTSCLPRMKVDWKGPINSPITSLSQFVSILATIKYMEFDSDIDWKLLTLVEPWHFGIIVNAQPTMSPLPQQFYPRIMLIISFLLSSSSYCSSIGS